MSHEQKELSDLITEYNLERITKEELFRECFKYDFEEIFEALVSALDIQRQAAGQFLHATKYGS